MRMRYNAFIAPRNAMSKRTSKSLNPRQELFCRYFAGLGERLLMANATASYMEAYGIKESKKSYQAARKSASDLLTNPHIKTMVDRLFNEQFKSEVIDNELLKAILQDKEIHAKVQAIREYNRLKGRVTGKIKVSTTPRAHLSDEQMRIIAELTIENLARNKT